MSLSPLLSLAALSLQKEQEWQPLEKKQSVARLGWWMRQSLLEKAVARSALLLQAENWGFLFLCKLQSSLPPANGQLPAPLGGAEQGWSEDGAALAFSLLFFQESILSLQLSRRLCADRSLFPGQRKQKQAADTWRASLRRFLTRTLCSLESCLDRVFYL